MSLLQTTEVASVPPSLPVTHECSRYSRARADAFRAPDGEPWRRRFRGWHCTSCHVDADHFACEHCGACMARGRAAWYCSTTCRVYAWKKRQAETDNDSRAASTFVIGNTHAERAAARYRRWRADADDGDVAGYLNRDSDHSGLFCGQCHRDLTPDEPVWRRGWHRGVTPLLCADCVNEGNERPQTPCDACSRPTVDMRRRPHVYDLERGRIKRTFCCTRCEQAFYRARHQARVAKRRSFDPPATCQTCDVVIEGARQGALYCSNACRQGAYRARRKGVAV